MKTAFGMVPIMFLIARSAFGCPNFSGEYYRSSGGTAFTLVQANCDSLTWLDQIQDPRTEKLDGKTYIYKDAAHDDRCHLTTETASWDGTKIVLSLEFKNICAQPPEDVLVSNTLEYSLAANGNLTSISTRVDHLFGNGLPRRTTSTYIRIR